ncbi:hypothetical protein FORC4_1253 [Vibrio parahaemolyticus]|nr:hypothetical protein FORC4_1253 [Vibrio parahaemolyticus]
MLFTAFSSQLVYSIEKEFCFNNATCRMTSYKSDYLLFIAFFIFVSTKKLDNKHALSAAQI